MGGNWGREMPALLYNQQLKLDKNLCKRSFPTVDVCSFSDYQWEVVLPPVAFSSLERILGGRFDDSFPACAFSFYLFIYLFILITRDQLVHISSTFFFSAMINPQWPSKLRQLRQSVT